MDYKYDKLVKDLESCGVRMFCKKMPGGYDSVNLYLVSEDNELNRDDLPDKSGKGVHFSTLVPVYNEEQLMIKLDAISEPFVMETVVYSPENIREMTHPEGQDVVYSEARLKASQYRQETGKDGSEGKYVELLLEGRKRIRETLSVYRSRQEKRKTINLAPDDKSKARNSGRNM